MSVFIRKDASDATYSYDFLYRGRRFSGSTGKTTRREAEQVERQKREEVKAAFSAERSLFASELTISSAVARYWQEVGQHHRNADNTLRSLEWLIQHFGAGTMVHDIGNAQVASMVARRRGEFVPSQRKPGRKYRKPEIRKRVSPATVNRTATQPLREIMLRAARIWGVKVADIRWRDHLLAEPKERVREARPDEEEVIQAELDRGYDDALQFAFLTGCRRMEIVPRSVGAEEDRYRGLVWTRVDFFSRHITVVGKGGKPRTIPMSRAVYDLLWSLRGHHEIFVFTFTAARTVRKGGEIVLKKGVRYPIVESGMKTAARRAIARAGVANFRFHDARHTAATRVLRKSNLRVVQELLGHADVATTAKYAHAMKEDIRAALDAMNEPDVRPRTEGPTEIPTETKSRA